MTYFRTMISGNIKNLRLKKGKSQAEMAEETGICRSTLAGYETGSNEPNIDRLKSIAGYFNITIDELINNKKIRNKQPDGNLKILTITVDSNNNENIELVPIKARAGYLEGYKDPEYIKRLPKFNLPNLPDGSYRAFEILGDSMLPINEGSIVLGKYIPEQADIKNNSRYVLVTKSDGVIFKRIVNESLEKLILYSDNPSYAPYTIDKETVLEIWSFHAYIGYPKNENTINMLDVVTRLNTIDNKLNKLLAD